MPERTCALSSHNTKDTRLSPETSYFLLYFQVMESGSVRKVEVERVPWTIAVNMYDLWCPCTTTLFFSAEESAHARSCRMHIFFWVCMMCASWGHVSARGIPPARALCLNC